MFLDELTLDSSEKDKQVAVLYSNGYDYEIRFIKKDEDEMTILIWNSQKCCKIAEFEVQEDDVVNMACCLVNSLRK